MAGFEELSPEIMMAAVEDAMDVRLSGLAAPLPSYINRVYEFAAAGGERLIAKFYRPGRWNLAALEDEHRFICACAAAEIPVVPPLPLRSGGTLGKTGEIYFAVYPKRSGREFELNGDEEWQRLGSLVARLHNVGSEEPANSRIMHHPQESTAMHVGWLLEGEYITPRYRREFADICNRLLRRIIPLFNDIEYIRIHGDLHRANILERPGEGLMVIDFDDMMVGPPVQDMWLLLPEYAEQCQTEIRMFLRGYTMLRDFDPWTLRLIEPLRAMRMIYFLAWISRQAEDYNFASHFPGWGTEQFWQREVGDLGRQLAMVEHSLSSKIQPSVERDGNI